jgi:tetratricopeptide (TPR) repeat protein
MPDPASALQSEERATELATRFFDPLLAEAQTDAVRATLLHQRGVLYLRSNFKQKAITDFNNALWLLPENHEERLDLFFHRACAYLLLPKPDALAAIRDINICLAAAPDDAEALIIRATAYRKLGKEKRAAADIDRAALLAPKSDTAVQELLKNAQGANRR